jgi:hypothetical protein
MPQEGRESGYGWVPLDKIMISPWGVESQSNPLGYSCRFPNSSVGISSGEAGLSSGGFLQAKCCDEGKKRLQRTLISKDF